jgi:hypothetical protein
MKKFVVEIDGFGVMAPIFDTKKQATAWAQRQLADKYKWAVKNV